LLLLLLVLLVLLHLDMFRESRHTSKQAILWMGSCAKRHRKQTLKRTAMSRELSYMKNEAVNTRPAMSRSTAKKGYSV
jgi:hypothetical protein